MTKPAENATTFAPSGNSLPCAWPWKTANAPTNTTAIHSGGRAASATISPRTIADDAMPVSRGQRQAHDPETPPNVITSGNTIGGTSNPTSMPYQFQHLPLGRLLM